MSKQGLAVIGVLLFMTGLVLFGWYQQNENRALARDVQQSGPSLDGPVNQTVCALPLVDVELPSRVMSEKESQVLTAVVANRYNTGLCEATLRLAAPDFTVSPAESIPQVAALQPGQQAALTWILSPRATGSYALVVSDSGQSETLGVVVTTVLGFTAAQAQLFSLLATFMGPLLTFPYWFERWEQRRAGPGESDGIRGEDGGVKGGR